MLLDHLAVSGETLEQAQSYVEEALGISMRPGGEHAVFHTHNKLMGLADGLYLEAIAINPDAPNPDRPRWFDLDRFSGNPRLSNWICRSEALDDEMALLPEGIGEAVALQRGDLRWQMVVPASGVLPFDNQCPALIQWQTAMHPAEMLPSSGCRLRRLVIAHPQAKELETAVKKALTDVRVVFEVGPQELMAEFDTPHGIRRL
jgi:hypothetical protein